MVEKGVGRADGGFSWAGGMGEGDGLKDGKSSKGRGGKGRDLVDLDRQLAGGYAKALLPFVRRGVLVALPS